MAPAIDLLLEYQSEYEDLLEVDLGYDPEDVELLTTNLEDMLLYFGEIFDWADEDGFYFLPEQDEKGRAKLENAHESYAYYDTERPLILYDSTLGRSGRDGFLVTDRYLYLKNDGQTVRLSLGYVLKDIDQGEDESNGCRYLYLDKYRIHLLNAGDIVKMSLLGEFLELIVSMILFLGMFYPKAERLSDALIWYHNLPPAQWTEPEEDDEPLEGDDTVTENDESPVCYCFECGAENEVGDRYCCECGAELI